MEEEEIVNNLMVGLMGLICELKVLCSGSCRYQLSCR